MKNIYFISESIPHNGYGSFVIFYRHLIRLRANSYKIYLIVPDYEDFESSEYFVDITGHFHIIKVPFNKWWYPPYRYYNKFLRNIRFSILYRKIKKVINENPPDFIITYFHGNFLNAFSVFLKNKFNCKMGVFLHDDKSLLNSKSDAKLIAYDKYICKNSSIIWTVSNQLKISGCDGNYIILPPIPAGDEIAINNNYSDKDLKLVIGYSGSIYESYFLTFQKLAKALEKIDGELFIIAENINRVKSHLNAFSNIRYIQSFQNSNQASEYLKQHCSVLFCGYPDALDEMPWIKNCFPSKFIEFTHLKIPIILSGPKNIVLTEWAKQNNWILLLDDFSENNLDAMLINLQNIEYRRMAAAQSINVSENEFNAEKIQLLFEQSLIDNI